MTLADDTVCPVSEGRLLPDGTGATALHFDKVGSASPVYTLSQMTLQCEVLGMATSVLDQIKTPFMGCCLEQVQVGA